MNALRTWRKANNKTLGEMARLIGVSDASLSRIERDEQWPERQIFERIAEVTAGQVTANDFLTPATAPTEEARA